MEKNVIRLVEESAQAAAMGDLQTVSKACPLVTRVDKLNVLSSSGCGQGQRICKEGADAMQTEAAVSNDRNY